MPVVPFTQRPDQPGAQPIPPPVFLAMAAAQVHEMGRLLQPVSDSETKPESLEDSVNRMGSARFAPETYTNPTDQKFLKNLPPDIERIERGNTIELRKRKSGEDLVS